MQDPDPTPKAVYRHLADVPKALANERRLEPLALLAQGVMWVARRDGRHVRYRLAGDDVPRLVHAIRAVGEACRAGHLPGAGPPEWRAAGYALETGASDG